MSKHHDKNKNQPMVVWQGYEYEYREKDRDWYIMLLIISVAVAIAAAMFQNYLLTVLILVSALSIAVHAYQKPDLKEFRIDERGIKIGKKLYPYHNIDSFWLDEKSEPPQLFFELTRVLIPLIVIPVRTLNLSSVKEILKTYLEEKEQEISIGHRIFDYFGF